MAKMIDCRVSYDWGGERPIRISIDDTVDVVADSNGVFVTVNPQLIDVTSLGDMPTTYIPVDSDSIEDKLIRAIDALEIALEITEVYGK